MNKSNFSNFHEGCVNHRNELLHADFLDFFLEEIRFFAESTDRLTVLEIYADIFDGFGGTTSSLLESLQEEYGKTSSLVAWGFTNPVEINSGKGTLIGELNMLNMPLVYESISEHADIFLPIDTKNFTRELFGGKVLDKNTIAYTTAISLESAFCFNTKQSNSAIEGGKMVVQDWCHAATCGRKLPIAALEVLIPEMQNNCKIESAIDQSLSTAVSDPRLLNAFATSASAAVSGEFGVQLEDYDKLISKSYSNMVCLRGCSEGENISNR